MIHIRNPQEVEKIRRSGRIVADTLQLVAEMIKPGIKPIELDAAAEAYIRSQGAKPAFKGLYGYPATLCVSVEDEVVHGIPDNTPLEEGQIVAIDVGAQKDGYHGDHARTFAVGIVDEQRQRLLNRTRECLSLGVQAAQAGNMIGDIGHVIQQHAESGGFGVVRELVGHGIGSRLHEEPQVPNFGQSGFGALLRDGMCLAIEPMINMGVKEVYTRSDGWTVCTADGKPSAHFEHTIVITSSGPEVLTEYEGD